MVVRDKGQRPRVEVAPDYSSMRVQEPPLLKSEERSEFETFRRDILSYLQCKSPIERIYAEDFIADSWEIARLRKALATLLNHKAKQHLALQNGPAKRSAESDPLAKVLAAVKRKLDGLPVDGDQEEPVEEVAEPSGSENVEADFQDVELADALAVESLIGLQVTFEQLINDKYKRRNDALRQIEWCRGFAERLKRASDAAIEAAVHGSKEEKLAAESTTLVPEIE
jgi:hypothetical protein